MSFSINPRLFCLGFLSWTIPFAAPSSDAKTVSVFNRFARSFLALSIFLAPMTLCVFVPPLANAGASCSSLFLHPASIRLGLFYHTFTSIAGHDRRLRLKTSVLSPPHHFLRRLPGVPAFLYPSSEIRSF